MATMSNVINFHEYKLKQERISVVESMFNIVNYLIDVFLHYVVYPIIAVRETILQKRIVVV